MKKTVCTLFAALGVFAAQSQTVLSDIENVTLPNHNNLVYNDSTGGGGFTSGDAFFACLWDTSFGGFWSSGWAASALYDSSTAGYTNPYGCAAYKGYSNSSKYAVGTTSMGLTIRLSGSSLGQPVAGMYVCNSTWAYKTMKYGDMFARKFGDTTGTNCGCAQGTYPDWFKLTVKRYFGGTLQNDSVEVYLADYRYSNSSQDYVLRNWTWVNLSQLSPTGGVDSLAFFLHSTDNGSFGMNTPAFFCVDDLGTNLVTNVTNLAAEEGISLVPNPAGAEMEIVVTTKTSQYVTVKITDVTGREMMSQSMQSFTGMNKIRADVSSYAAGVYYVTLQGENGTLTKKLIKQ